MISRKHLSQNIAFGLFRLLSLSVVGILFAILGFIIYKGIGVIDWEFLTGAPTDGMTSGGILPAIVGTFCLMTGSALFAFPVGVMSGIYMNEYAPKGWIVRFIRMMTNNLSGIPSIVFGLFGMALFVNYMDFGDSILAGSLTLGLLSLPLVIRTTEEALKAIPDNLREGSRALGATKQQTIWHVILPMGMPNIITGLILALGRVSGETAPILFTCAAYFLPQLPGSIFDQCMALPMNVLLGWHIQTIIVVTSVAIVLYSMLGGMKAVIWTEAIQGIILIGGALVCMFILLFDMPGGPVQTFSIAMEDGKFSLGSFGSSLSESTFWVCLIYGIFTNLQNYGIDQSYVQRYHTAKNEKEAKFSALFGGYLFIPVSAVFFMIGTGLYAFYKVHPGILPDGVGADYVFPFFIVNELPVGLTGLLIASIFAAGMSTIATSVTSSSTIILTDYYQRFRKHAGNRERMLVLKLSSVGVGVAGILVAFAFMSVQSALDAWWALASIFSGGMLGLFLLGYISRKARNFDAVLGVVCGVILVCWIVISPFVHANLAIVFGTLLIFLVGFLSANLLNKRRCK